MASPSSISAAVTGTVFIPSLPSSSPSSLSSSLRPASFPMRKPFFLGGRTRLLCSPSQSRQQHFFAAPRAVQAEIKEPEKQEDTDESDSDYESSDEGNYGFVSKEPEVPTVANLLKLYKEALPNNNEVVIADVESKLLSIEKDRDTLAKQVSTLNIDVSAAKDRALRSSAEFDNFRKRSEKERLAVSTNVKGDVVGSLLPMIDNFERAKLQIKIETEGEQRIDSSYQGIYKQFVEIMKGFGVTMVETVGKAFDPNVHEAIMREESTQFAEGVVIEEFRRGFMLGEKLLRPAMVKVSSGPPASSAANGVAAMEQTESGVVSSVEESV